MNETPSTQYPYGFDPTSELPSLGISFESGRLPRGVIVPRFSALWSRIGKVPDLGIYSRAMQASRWRQALIMAGALVISLLQWTRLRTGHVPGQEFYFVTYSPDIPLGYTASVLNG